MESQACCDTCADVAGASLSLTIKFSHPRSALPLLMQPIACNTWFLALIRFLSASACSAASSVVSFFFGSTYGTV